MRIKLNNEITDIDISEYNSTIYAFSFDRNELLLKSLPFKKTIFIDNRGS
jgi:hypothetical protein